MYVAFRSAKMRSFAERTATYRENPASKSLAALPQREALRAAISPVINPEMVRTDREPVSLTGSPPNVKRRDRPEG